MNVLLFYSTTERCFLVLGVICATILGCCVPAAVYSVGEVVNLFITNRRSRLAALIDHERQLGHTELANDITDYDGDTEALMDELSRDLDETVATVDSINSSSQIGLLDRLHGNITTADELLLNQELNVDFLDRLYFLIGCLVVISCTQFVTASTMTMVFNICTQRMASRWRKVIQSEEFINLENKEFSTISLLKDIEQIERGLGVRFPHLIFGFVTLIGCLILAFFKRWELAMILLPILFVGLFGKPLVTKLQKKSNQRVNKARNEAKNSLEKSLENLSTVVAFQGKTTEILKYEQSLYHVKTAVDHKMVIIGIGNGMLTMIPHLLNAIMLWIGVRLIISDLNRSIDKFLPGTPVMVFFCYLRGLLTFNKGWIFYDDIKKAFKSVEKLVKVMKVLRIGKKGFFEINLQIADEKLKNVQSRDKKNFFSFGDRRLRTPSAVHRLAFPMNSSRLRFSSLDERKSLELGNCKETLVLLIRFVTSDAIYLVVGCFASILLGIIFPMLFYMFCEIIGAMANLDDDTVYRRTTSCVIIYACLGAATLLGTYLQNQMNEKVAVRLCNRLRKCLFVTFLKKAELDYEGSMSSLKNFRKILSNDIPSLEKALISVCGPGLQFLSAVAASIPIAMSVQWAQALLLSLIIPVLFSAYVIYHYFINRKSKTTLTTFRRTQRSRLILKRNIIEAMLNGCFCAIREMAFGTILIYGGQLIVHHGVSNKDVLQINLVIINPVLQIGQVINSGVELLSGWKAMKKISGFLFSNFTNENKISCSAQSQGSRISPTLEALDVVLQRENIFPGGSTNCQGFTFSVRSGQTVKLLDKYNHKELCLRTLLGLRRPARGSILINGVDIDLLSPSWLRQFVTVADDSFPFFANLTLIENLSYGNQSWDEETILNLLINFDLLATFEKFPQGLQSKYCDISSQLSVEENKKLILIRSLQRNPSILILTEEFLFRNIMEHLEDSIMVIVCSRYDMNPKNTK